MGIVVDYSQRAFAVALHGQVSAACLYAAESYTRHVVWTRIL